MVAKSRADQLFAVAHMAAGLFRPAYQTSLPYMAEGITQVLTARQSDDAGGGGINRAGQVPDILGSSPRLGRAFHGVSAEAAGPVKIDPKPADCRLGVLIRMNGGVDRVGNEVTI